MRGPKTKKELLKYTWLISGLAILLAGLSFLFLDLRLSEYFGLIELTSTRNVAKVLTDAGLADPYFIFAGFLFLISHWIVTEKRLHPYKNLFKWLKTWSLNFLAAM